MTTRIHTVLSSLTYTYDGLGNRINRQLTTGSNVSNIGYVVDPTTALSQVLRETETTTSGGSQPSTTTRHYMLGMDVLGYEQISDVETFEPRWSFFGYDALGSVRQSYNGDNGDLRLSMMYDPFGSVLSQAGLNPSELGFTGEQTDPNGLQYLRARYMNPATGTFLSRDPVEGAMGRLASMNGYGYAEGNPAIFTDPSGKCVGPLLVICGIAIAGLIGVGYGAFTSARKWDIAHGCGCGDAAVLGSDRTNFILGSSATGGLVGTGVGALIAVARVLALPIGRLI
jgi:RHS repeat-associated protein